jgi:hypothetical protein
MILASSVIKFIAHLYNYVFYNGYFIVNGLNRAYDVPQHLVYAMEILRGNWPFQNPMAVGFPIDYPIGLPLLIAVLVGITGTPIHHVFRFFPIILNIFVGLTGYIMVSSLCKSKRIAFYATFFILFSGGLLWITESFPIVKEFWTLYKYLRIEENFYADSISANLFRPLSRTFGFGLFCFYFYFLNSFLRSNKIKLIFINGILLGVLLNTSPGMAFALLFLSIIALLYFKISPSNILKYLLIIGLLSLFSSPLLFQLVLGFSKGEGLLSLLSHGWRYLSPIYYPSFFGLAFLFMILGLFSYSMDDNTRKFLLLWLTMALFLANLVPVGIALQTHNFTLLLNIPVYIFSSLGLVKILEFDLSNWNTNWLIKKLETFGIPSFFNINNFKRYIVPLMLVSCCISPVFQFVYTFGYEKNMFVEEQEYSALIWIQENTDTNAVFLTFHYINIEKSEISGEYKRAGRGHSLVTTIGERRVLLNLRAVFLSKGMNHEEIMNLATDIDFIYTSNDLQKCLTMLESYSIKYIYLGPDEQERYTVAMEKFENQKYFEGVYINNLVTIYKLKTS